MRDDAGAVQPYEPPSIDERTPIALPLIGGVTSGLPGTPSAAFRSVPPKRYEAPRILARDPLDVPLIGIAGSGVDSDDSSAVFRSQ